MTMIVVGSIHDDQPSIQPQSQSRQQDRCAFCQLLVHSNDNYKNTSGEKIPMDLGTEKPHNCLSSSMAKHSMLSLDEFCELEHRYSQNGVRL
jgi:hypothetical protein